jgi:hypothetical protein
VHDASKLNYCFSRFSHRALECVEH